MKRGQQRRIPATRPGAKQKRHIFGGYNWLEDCPGYKDHPVGILGFSVQILSVVGSGY
jgi:hypothetical protein